jgi:hypothetical protein
MGRGSREGRGGEEESAQVSGFLGEREERGRGLRVRLGSEELKLKP